MLKIFTLLSFLPKYILSKTLTLSFRTHYPELAALNLILTLEHFKLQVYENTEVKKRVALSNPYGTWVQENMRTLKAVNFLSSTIADNDAILRRQQLVFYFIGNNDP